MVLTADSILARSTRRRQTAIGWNTAFIGANRYSLLPGEKPPSDDAPYTVIAGHAPNDGGGQLWLVLAGDATVDGSDRLPANSCIFIGPQKAAFAGASGPLGAELLCLQFRRRAQD